MSLREQVVEHWQSFKNPLINDILINLEKLEGEHIEVNDDDTKSIETLLQKLEKIQASDVDEIEFIRLLNQMPVASMLFIIHKLQTLNSDLIMRIISYAQKYSKDDKEVAKFFQRNMVFEKAQLLGRIFSNDRMEKILSIL
ncbi:MAG: hypothetical protein COB50_03010 [Thiotrichales bacterium]|nr:MAG: hypothetical protein COB50_03010 [Thiotrichales bacterium]